MAKSALLIAACLSVLAAAMMLGTSHAVSLDDVTTLDLEEALGGGSLPVVLWHGMGDWSNSPGMADLAKLITKQTGSYVHSVRIGSSDEQDQYDGFFKPVNEQIAMVCAALKADPQLKGGFNAIGFSQGGQFLRAYVQRCNDPPVHNLISVGGQHFGVFGLPRCEATNHTLCEWMRELLDVGAYVGFVQDRLVQAQYWNDPFKQQEYIAKSQFIADINNQKAQKNSTYAVNLKSLNKFVLVKFTEDSMVQPRDSEWFGFYAPGQDKQTIPLQQTDVYQQDWLGLKVMDQAGKIDFLSVVGDHLRFTEQWFIDNIINKYLR